jgi:very-short-patch-repair endonuclease/transposase
VVYLEKLYQDEKWLRQKIEIENIPRTEIAKMFNVSEPTIAYFARKYGIQRPGSTKKPENLNRASLCKDKDWLEYQYITLNKSYDEISKEFNIGKTTVARWVKKHGLVKENKRKNAHPPVLVACQYCGKPKEQKYAKVKNGLGKFCSQSCASKYRIEHYGMDKLLEGHRRFVNSEEGKKLMKQNGVKAAIVLSRKKRTSIEEAMANELKSRGIKYIEQYNLGNKFALDFFLPDYNIVIECDGDYWHRRPEAIRRDKAKNAYIKACGLSLYRFWESEIKEDVEACVDLVMVEINKKDVV